jgi:hypothetical protein
MILPTVLPLTANACSIYAIISCIRGKSVCAMRRTCSEFSVSSAFMPAGALKDILCGYGMLSL